MKLWKIAILSDFSVQFSMRQFANINPGRANFRALKGRLRTMLGKFFKGLAGVLLVMMGVGGAIGQQMIAPQMSEFKAKQKTTVAVIVDLEKADKVSKPSHLRGNAARGAYALANVAAMPTGTYEFTVENGKTYRDDFSIDREKFDQLSIGNTLKIWYIPDNPNQSGLVNRLDGQPEETPRGIQIFVTLGFFIWGFYLLYRATENKSAPVKALNVPKASTFKATSGKASAAKTRDRLSRLAGNGK